MISEERGSGGVETRGAAGINGRAARDQGMGLREPAVEGQRGIEDVRQQDACGGDHIRGARAEALHPSGAVDTKEIVVVGNDRASIENFSTAVKALLPETSVRASVRVPWRSPPRRHRLEAELPVMVLLVTVRCRRSSPPRRRSGRNCP